MAHQQQFDYIQGLKSKFPFYFSKKKVLEVGSLDINGSIRGFFHDCDYLGVDVAKGPGVDLVCEGQSLDHEANTYDTVGSCECFEHNPHWVETFKNMHRVAKPRGLIFMTCATTGRPEHGTSRTSPHASPLTVEKGWDYYKNLTENDFIENMDINNMFSEYKFKVNPESCDLYFYGIKSDDEQTQIMRNPELKAVATYLTPKDVARLDKLAKHYNWSRSTILLRAVQLVLDDPKVLTVQLSKVGS
jgi:SAM-dependent methyltransferase